jgi:succinate-acetate transporter protein
MSAHGGDWANPGPAGLAALGVACFIFYAILSGKVSHDAIPLMGLWLLGGFAIQFTVAVIELKEGNISGGNIFLLFSGFFMLTSGLSFIFKYFAAVNGWAIDPHIDGWAWLILWISVWLWTPAFFDKPMVFILMVLSICVACPFICLIDLGAIGHEYAAIPANALLIAGALGTYFAAAGILNTTYGKVILPVGKPLVKGPDL